MIGFNVPGKLSRRILMLTAGIFLIAATEGALAKGGSSGGGMRGPAFGPCSGAHVGMTSHESNRDRDHDRGDKYSDKHKDKDHDRYAGKCKHPAPGTCGTNTIHPIINPNPKPVASPPPPASPPGPIVRDHRPGGNAAGLVPGTIIRDHRNGADGKPVVVVSSSGGVTVTRPATGADLQKAGLLPKPAPYGVTVPIGALGGGR
jgi:hypothetical protein